MKYSTKFYHRMDELKNAGHSLAKSRRNFWKSGWGRTVQCLDCKKHFHFPPDEMEHDFMFNVEYKFKCKGNGLVPTKNEMIEFTSDRESLELITKIADRALTFYEKQGIDRDKLDIIMDLSACHASCPLQLEEMLKGTPFDFTHDIAGIYKHMNRETGELEGCFLPRFADLQTDNEQNAKEGEPQMNSVG